LIAGELAPPSALRAEAANGQVTLTWQASPTPGIVGYRLKRSTAPAAQQETRVYLAPGAPRLQPYDYVVVARRFGNFDMKYVNSRVRGIGNPVDAPAWYWNGDLKKLKFSLVPHPAPVPAELRDPGETCLRVEAAAGEQYLDQFTFIGTQMGNESLWYGQLEPGRPYQLEVWLRQEGLGNDGRVSFSFGRGYPALRSDFQVSGQWACYRAEFVGPERPGQEWHFGPRFTFAGPGTLWIENARLFRCDRPEDADRPYVPNQTVLDELLSIQPERGPKGVHRIWFLDRDATMDSILSWHAGSEVRPDWRTAVNGTMDMTLPMGLTFDLATGAEPANRMRPWLVLQHILHTEQDWLNLIEYLAAPYDPAKDSPATRPYAHRRFTQRGVGTPWTEEFTELLIEFGNETWHNGVFDDWLGFATRNAVHQGGREYGLFTRYLVEVMQRSPYWRSEGLDQKIRFVLGGNYDGRVRPDGRVTGYGEEAMQANPAATVLGHANYVGPKWETGEYSARNYDDHGVQECLLSFLAGPRAGQQRMGQAREALAKTGLDYDIAAYEGGPGGFALPGRADPAQVEVNEKYGKSLAQAVGAFDGWLQSYEFGWTEQCFFSYGQGNHWNSHTPLWNGFRPTPAWLAAGLRNRQAGGDLMRVVTNTTPTIARQAQEYPLVGAYAFRDGARWTVFVVSRKLDGQHDGVDFGDGTTPVTLRLPFTTARAVTLHKLAADPRLTNREALNVKLERLDLPASSLRDGTLRIDATTGGLPTGLPPGAIYAYVLETP
ncbi:MAG: hypothetical protein HUU35_03335, partial [Armatimonadetes bacterium]|nr:hypothetical protein [Armatimonadota bacterium]